MALPGGYFLPSRYSFSGANMFSFSLDPEITSFFWINSPALPPSDIDLALRYRLAHPSNLYQIFVSSSDPSAQQATFFSTLQCTVVTTGILVIVGVSSLYTYKLLQCIRQSVDHSSSLLENVKNLISNLSRSLARHWRKFRGDRNHRQQQAAIVSGNNNGSTMESEKQQMFKRPSDLQILPKNGSPVLHQSRFVTRSSRDNSLERRLMEKARTPLQDCDIASGEEDISDVQGQYFGPTARSSVLCMEWMGSSPEESPIHALTPSKQQAFRASPKRGKRLDRDDDHRESSC